MLQIYGYKWINVQRYVMFPHTITVVNIYDDKDVLIFNNCIVSDVFFYDKKIISQESKGENYSNTYNCVFSNESLKNIKQKMILLLQQKIKLLSLKELKK